MCKQTHVENKCSMLGCLTIIHINVKFEYIITPFHCIHKQIVEVLGNQISKIKNKIMNTNSDSDALS